jgi:hypothetical protein
MMIRYVGERWTCLLEFTNTGALTEALGLSADQLDGAVYYAPGAKREPGTIEVVARPSPGFKKKGK